MHARNLVLSVVLLLAGCSGSPTGQLPQTGTSPRPLAAAYEHTFACSRFDIGIVENAWVSEYGCDKVIGTRGVFSVGSVNRSVAAIQNANIAPGPAYAFGGQQHNADVLAYFEGCGLPSDQISGVSLTTSSYGYASIVNRAVSGVPVIDSLANAHLEANGLSSGEDVYWPAVPGEILSDALALQHTMSDPAARDSYLSALPLGLGAGQVVIRHSSSTVPDNFVIFASYDAPDSTGVRRHFDSTGAERRLPQELP